MKQYAQGSVAVAVSSPRVRSCNLRFDTILNDNSIKMDQIKNDL